MDTKWDIRGEEAQVIPAWNLMCFKNLYAGCSLQHVSHQNMLVSLASPPNILHMNMKWESWKWWTKLFCTLPGGGYQRTLRKTGSPVEKVGSVIEAPNKQLWCGHTFLWRCKPCDPWKGPWCLQAHMDISLFLILHAPARFSFVFFFKLNHHIKMNAHRPLQNFEFPVLKGTWRPFCQTPAWCWILLKNPKQPTLPSAIWESPLQAPRVLTRWSLYRHWPQAILRSDRSPVSLFPEPPRTSLRPPQQNTALKRALPRPSELWVLSLPKCILHNPNIQVTR